MQDTHFKDSLKNGSQKCFISFKVLIYIIILLAMMKAIVFFHFGPSEDIFKILFNVHQINIIIQNILDKISERS